ncbi:4-aminobutyrate--2-oxoglutarate transaminase [Pseudalkalibacillus salsuginis]|uniref:4-aminobutyrate--2-oxoglutarate transaminase n=1 Tax=Pseudalkalibacillus salsuginis TaxID=2910972 RepID=UPI001F448F7C|nr:4-aminobutyrate--2-oxoglutarate transaminase [Pseudalkalibacillus salsuginis]MCF6412021.1 4-aminobutyrate--2-oxoglutarate transaminase [Pseudalkalibacillus salsuginis]
MKAATKKYINLKTPLPGPKSQELIKRKEENVPRGPFNTSPAFIKQAEGAMITDIDGNTLIDLAGAIGSLNAGHCPPNVVKAIQEQVEKYIHPCFHVMMYEPYIELAEKLNEITPGNHAKKTFFLNSGAEAVENAVKIARKYTGRRAIVSFDRGYHGRTLLTMSLTSKVKPYKNGFGPFATDTYKLRHPYYYRKPQGMMDEELDELYLNQINDFFLGEVPPEDIAAFIMEPIQGEGGFIEPSKNFVQKVREICREHGILFIADEVQTGFGRIGKMFASEHFDIDPDLITMSKSIAAGMPISAVTGRAEVMDAPNPGEIGGTYGGSPLGCVAALEVIKSLQEDGLVERANHIGDMITERFQSLQETYGNIGDVRGVGAMCAMEIVKGQNTMEPDKELTGKIVAECNRRGVILLGAGLYGNVIRTLSPLVITDDQLTEALDVIEEVIHDLT